MPLQALFLVTHILHCSCFSRPIAEVFQYMLALIANSRLGYTCHYAKLNGSSLKTTHSDINNYDSITVAYSRQITLHNHKIIAHHDNTLLILKSLQEKQGFLVQCFSMHVLIGPTLHKKIGNRHVSNISVGK